MMSKRTIHLFLFLGGLLIWGWITWPLPRHFSSAIPWTDRLQEGGDRTRELVPGDHLQLYYHFWLAREAMQGKTPPFSNVYEFNMGDEVQRASFDPQYLPFSAVYALTSPMLGGPAGWNLAGLASILLGLFGAYALARRYAGSRQIALGIALVTMVFPYRWITLLGGSPTGFGIGLIPWLLVGLDQAVRDHRPAGGLIAGLALLGTYASDLHCFYFSALMVPFWCLLAWGTQGQPLLSFTVARMRKTIIALLPMLLLAGVAVGLSILSSSHLAGTDMADGRSWEDVQRFSPIISGLFRWQSLGPANHIFFSTSLMLLLIAGGLLKVRALLNPQHTNQPCQAQKTTNGCVTSQNWMILLLILGSAGIIMLALGTNGPAGGLPLKVARRLLPKFTMIRQTPKILCLMPSLLTVTLALLLAPLAQYTRRRQRIWSILLVLLGMATIAESSLWFRAGLSSLPADMPAYKAVRQHAELKDNPRPHALALPLWPGDSHYSSIYEYGIIHSRLRLLNGYAPAIPDGYRERVLKPLDSLNHGILTTNQIAQLKTLGAAYIIFHEQPYPAKVSLFPSALALRRLMQNPWLEPLAVDGAMRSFAILDTPRPPDEIAKLWGPPRYLPAMHWVPRRQPQAHDTSFVFPLTLRAPAAPAPHLRYLMRVSGGGTLTSDSGTKLMIPAVASWIETPMTPPFGDRWHVTSGTPAIEYATIIAGQDSDVLKSGDGYWAAADLFHRGITDTASGRVRCDPRRMAQGLTLYGPCLPLPAGRYRGRLMTEPIEPEDAGIEIGNLLVVVMEGRQARELTRLPVRLGETLACDFDYDGSWPLKLEFHYHRNLPLWINSLELKPQPYQHETSPGL